MNSYELIINRKKIKNIYIRITSNTRVELSIPLKTSEKDINNIIKDRREWIEKNINKREIKELIYSNNHIYLLGKKYHLALIEDTKNKVDVIEDRCVIYAKNGSYKKVLNIFLKKHFSLFSKNILKKYEIEFNARYNNLYFRDNYRTLGSCSIKNDLMLSYRLYTLPKEAIEYVIVHELAHIKYKNHSKLFYNELQRLLPNYKIYKEKINHFDLRGKIG